MASPEESGDAFFFCSNRHGPDIGYPRSDADGMWLERIAGNSAPGNPWGRGPGREAELAGAAASDQCATGTGGAGEAEVAFRDGYQGGVELCHQYGHRFYIYSIRFHPVFFSEVFANQILHT